MKKGWFQQKYIEYLPIVLSAGLSAGLIMWGLTSCHEAPTGVTASVNKAVCVEGMSGTACLVTLQNGQKINTTFYTTEGETLCRTNITWRLCR